jgi:hypothetical protein
MYKEPAEGFGSITNEDGTPWYPNQGMPGTREANELGGVKTVNPNLSKIRGNAKMKARKDNRGQVLDAMKSFADKLVKIILK